MQRNSDGDSIACLVILLVTCHMFMCHMFICHMSYVCHDAANTFRERLCEDSESIGIY